MPKRRGTANAVVVPLAVGGMPMLLLSASCGHPLNRIDLVNRTEAMWDVLSTKPHLIYGNLKKLETLGYVRRVGEHGGEPDAKLHWVITREGEEALDACWYELLAWQRKRRAA